MSPTSTTTIATIVAMHTEQLLSAREIAVVVKMHHETVRRILAKSGQYEPRPHLTRIHTQVIAAMEASKAATGLDYQQNQYWTSPVAMADLIPRLTQLRKQGVSVSAMARAIGGRRKHIYMILGHDYSMPKTDLEKPPSDPTPEEIKERAAAIRAERESK